MDASNLSNFASGEILLALAAEWQPTTHPCGCVELEGRCAVHQAMMDAIYEAWHGRSVTTMRAIYAESDGYGIVGFVPVQGFDWSGIRDSTPAAIERMWKAAAK